MSGDDPIEKLLREVESLRDQVQARDRDEEMQAMEAERDRAVRERDIAAQERDRAVAELAKVKADVQWTMGNLLVSDLLYYRSGDPDIGAAAQEGWLPLSYDPEDTARLEWINKHGRLGVSDHHITIALTHGLTLQERLPCPYNIRHWIDLLRKFESVDLKQAAASDADPIPQSE
jgi:hypothetical protein